MAIPVNIHRDRLPHVDLELGLARSNKCVAQPVFPPKRKKPGSRTWMRFDSSGVCESLELDRNAIMQRTSIPARDLRILGPVFSQSTQILARERAMVVNLQFITVIVTAEELFLLDATSAPVLPFVEQLKEQFPLQNACHPSQEEEQLESVHADVRSHLQSVSHMSQGEQPESVHIDVRSPEDPVFDGQQLVVWNPPEDFTEGRPDQLPFEFGVLEIVLEVVCNYLDDRVSDLELKAYPILDEFTRNITPSNLELVRSLKSVTTRLTARVQNVRDELEQLLNDDDDMADLYLTRRKAAQELHLGSRSISLRHGTENEGPFGNFGSFRASLLSGATSMATSVSGLGNEEQKVIKRDELEQLLDDVDDMADLNLTHKVEQKLHLDSPSTSLGENGSRPFGTFASGLKTSKLSGATSMAASVSLGKKNIRQHKVRDELQEPLLDDNDNMADRHLTHKAAQELHLRSPLISLCGNGGPCGTFGSPQASEIIGAKASMSAKVGLGNKNIEEQKVKMRDEQLPLDDNGDMADLYHSRKATQELRSDSPSISLHGQSPFGTFGSFGSLQASEFTRATSMAASTVSVRRGKEDVEELEMLLEAYFIQLDGTLNKLTTIREYIDDSEDYIKIQLDHKRNQLFQFQIILAGWMLAIGVGTAIFGAVSMNIHNPMYTNNDIVVPFVVGTLTIVVCIFLSVIVHVHMKGLLE